MRSKDDYTRTQIEPKYMKRIQGVHSIRYELEMPNVTLNAKSHGIRTLSS